MAVEEKSRELLLSRNLLMEEKKKLRSSFNMMEQIEAIRKLESKSETTEKLLNRTMNKVDFHLQERTKIDFSRRKKVRMKLAKQSNRRRKKNHQNYYRKRKKQKNEEKMNNIIAKIKEENIVVNL